MPPLSLGSAGDVVFSCCPSVHACMYVLVWDVVSVISMGALVDFLHIVSSARRCTD